MTTGNAMFRRRSILKIGTALPLISYFSAGRAHSGEGAVSFHHGVASGDPGETSILLWTRITAPQPEGKIRFHWQIAADEHFKRVVGEGRGTTGPERDFTVKVVAEGLSPGTSYYYQFHSGRSKSVVGRTRTLPTGHVAASRFAVVSCSNYPAGYFNAYRDIANHADIEAVLHLGDYIYEYGLDGYASENAEAMGRSSRPKHKLRTLEDYRARHAQYRTDPDLQLLHARHPMIAVWDDHEFLNNSWAGGSEGFQGTEDQWRQQRTAALRAYREWMPIRDHADRPADEVFRSFRYGDLLSLVMLDTRHVGRSQQLAYGSGTSLADAERHDASRTILGSEQERWLATTIERSRAQKWQVIGQQTPVGELRLPRRLGEILVPGAPSRFPPPVLESFVKLSRQGLPFVLETWDGYTHARRRLLQLLCEQARNPIILTGDVHTAMAMKLRKAAGEHIDAIELVTPSITSPGLEEYFPAKGDSLAKAFMEANPDMLFLDGRRHGWIDIHLTHQRVVATWQVVDTIRSRKYVSAPAYQLELQPKRRGSGFEGIKFSGGGRSV